MLENKDIQPAQDLHRGIYKRRLFPFWIWSLCGWLRRLVEQGKYLLWLSIPRCPRCDGSITQEASRLLVDESSLSYLCSQT